MNVSISAAAQGDLPVMLELIARSKLPRAGVEAHLGSALVAREGDRIIGCAAVELYGSAGLLRSVAIDLPHRGLGLGIQLTEAALALARERGVRTLYLLTETAGGFFPRFGFRPIPRAQVDAAVQRSVEFTTACSTSALVMRLQL
jgi:amino-acid N-acetyltransferase